MCTPNPDSCGGGGACLGSIAELAYDYATESEGLFQEFQNGCTAYYGLNSSCAVPSGKGVAKINGYVKLPENNYLALLNAVARVGPIAVSVASSFWIGYESGILRFYLLFKNIVV
jgi:cathepsin L